VKGVIILANGFEDTEAITTIDVLKRSGLEIITAAVGIDLEVVSQYNQHIKAEISINTIDHNQFDFLIIPGGRAVPTVLDKLPKIDSLINDFINSNKLVAAICAAPSLLGKNRHLHTLDYTCFPGSETSVIGGNLKADGVIVTDKIITAKAMYYTIDFSLAIIEKLQGKEQREKVLKAIKGE
jgi:4-methyl-5(b-hydroxyethyl)-thiazole monophosphate biosynthesis